MFPLVLRENEHYLLSYYIKPHTRYGPFLIGILTGMYLKRRKGPLVKQKVGTGPFPSSRFIIRIETPLRCCCAPHPSGRQHLDGSSVSRSWLR